MEKVNAVMLDLSVKCIRKTDISTSVLLVSKLIGLATFVLEADKISLYICLDKKSKK